MAPVPATRFLLIRHAESVWNVEGRWQGQADPPLSARGREAVVAAGERLASLGVEALVSSDLQRAAETARGIGDVLGLEPRFDSGLREWNVGSWSGLPQQEIERRFPAELARLREGDPDLRPGGGETWPELRERVLGSLSSVAAFARGRCVAVVTHRGVIRSVCPGARIENLGFVSFELP